MIVIKKPHEIVWYVFEEYTTNVISNISCINAGGCGIFAENLYKTFKSFNIDCKLVIITDTAAGMEKRLEVELTDPNASGYARLYHIMVEVDGKFVDSDGVFDSYSKDYGRTEITDLSIETLERWNKIEEGFWNHWFDRKQIPLIEMGFDKINELVKEKFVKVQD